MSALRWAGVIATGALFAGGAAAKDLLRQSVGPGDYVISVQMAIPTPVPLALWGENCIEQPRGCDRWPFQTQPKCTISMVPQRLNQKWRLAAFSCGSLYKCPPSAAGAYIDAPSLEAAGELVGALTDAARPEVPLDRQLHLLHVDQAYTMREIVILHRSSVKSGARCVSVLEVEARSEASLKPEPIDVRGLKRLRTAYDN
jgi:hypothetical protein